jgi:hypothetical protein
MRKNRQATAHLSDIYAETTSMSLDLLPPLAI